MPKIMVNGQSYDSPDDMPASVRDAYLKAMEVLHDSDGNGVPDFLEGKPIQNINNGSVSMNLRSGSLIILGDKIFTDPNELPPDARLKYDQAVAKLGPLMSDLNGNGIPDMLEGKPGNAQSQTVITASTPMQAPSLVSQEPPSSVIQEESSNFGAIVLVILAVLFLIGALGAGVYIFLNMVR
jgi:hypothetical protein